MNFQNCKECGRAFQSPMPQKVCDTCKNKHDKAYKILKEHLLDDPNIPMSQLAQETGIDRAEIQKLCRDGLIKVYDDATDNLACERCARAISHGRYCDTCTHEMKGMLNSASHDILLKGADSAAKKSGGGFHSRTRG